MADAPQEVPLGCEDELLVNAYIELKAGAVINWGMIYLNNRLVPDDKALISVYDHGFLYGDGIYETLRAYEGGIFKLESHIERLFRSASLIKLTIPFSPEKIKTVVHETIKANRQKEAVIRITLSRGAGPTGLDPDLCEKPTFIVMSREFKGYPASYYRKGVKIAVVKTRRNFKGAIDPQIKSLNFLNNVLAKIEARDLGVYEAIMLNYRGFLTEGTVSNLFFVKDNTLCTPSVGTGILDGITRKTILDCAEELNIHIREGRFKKEDLYRADEVFISNTTMEIMPVSEANRHKTGRSPGKTSRLLLKAYRKKVIEEINR